MDMLAGYGSDDDSDAPEAPPVQEVQQQQQQPAQQQQAKAAVAVAPHTAQAEPSIKLPSPAELLGGAAAAAGGASAAQPAKRPFAAVTGHSLAKATSQPKASKEHAAARPGTGAKTSSGMLLPPQLRGRSNVVTEDLANMFTKKASPAKRKPA